MSPDRVNNIFFSFILVWIGCKFLCCLHLKKLLPGSCPCFQGTANEAYLHKTPYVLKSEQGCHDLLSLREHTNSWWAEHMPILRTFFTLSCSSDLGHILILKCPRNFTALRDPPASSVKDTYMHITWISTYKTTKYLIWTLCINTLPSTHNALTLFHYYYKNHQFSYRNQPSSMPRKQEDEIWTKSHKCRFSNISQSNTKQQLRIPVISHYRTNIMK